MPRIAICYDGAAPLELLTAAGLTVDNHLPRHQVVYGTCHERDVPSLELVAGVDVVTALAS